MLYDQTFLLKNVTVDTDGAPIVADGSSKTLLIEGDLGGGSVTIQVSRDLVNWITVEYGGNPAIFTVPCCKLINYVGQGLKIRATLTGSSGLTTNVSVGIY